MTAPITRQIRTQALYWLLVDWTGTLSLHPRHRWAFGPSVNHRQLSSACPGRNHVSTVNKACLFATRLCGLSPKVNHGVPNGT
ncbi:hypothetical protein V8C35DRAFT_81840 [Trichoderma chlorosporum]